MESTTAGFLGTIIGGGIGGLATYVSANIMFREQRFDAAVTKFRFIIIAAFKEIILASNEQIAYGEPNHKIPKSTTEITIGAFEFQFFAENRTVQILIPCNRPSKFSCLLFG